MVESHVLLLASYVHLASLAKASINRLPAQAICRYMCVLN